MITVQIPGSARAEREYVLDILLRRWLGLEFRLECGPDEGNVVVFQGANGTVVQPDLFLREADRDWGGEATCPAASCYKLRGNLPPEWSERIGEPDLPILFELKDEPLIVRKVNPDGVSEIKIAVDLIGTAFFFLSRYEEVSGGGERDEHDRFPARSSCAGKAGLLNRPVVNEYLELLWLLLSEIEPGATRMDRSFRVVPTHDVDRPFRYRGVSANRIARSSYSRLRAGESLGRVLSSGRRWLKQKIGTPVQDPYFTFPWIMETSAAQGLQNVFYMQCTNSHHKQDDNYDYLDRELRLVVRDAERCGHRVGVHPGYGTYESADALEEEIERFRELWQRADCGELNELRSRQHYLRWNQAITPSLLDRAGIAYDSTLGFADTPGFRCGCCYEYPLYDLVNRRPLRIIEEPLVLMECSIIDDRYLGLGVGESALELARNVWSKCRHFNGQFVFLWHNHRLVETGERDLYEAILRMDEGAKLDQ